MRGCVEEHAACAALLEHGRIFHCAGPFGSVLPQSMQPLHMLEATGITCPPRGATFVPLSWILRHSDPGTWTQ